MEKDLQCSGKFPLGNSISVVVNWQNQKIIHMSQSLEFSFSTMSGFFLCPCMNKSQTGTIQVLAQMGLTRTGGAGQAKVDLLSSCGIME